MPIQKIAGTEYGYYMIVHDDVGNERAEPDGSFLSKNLLARLADAAHPVTDLFVACHGWQGDVPAAIRQYDAWVGTMAGLQQDIDAAHRLRTGFTPLIVGLHWPSLPWGDETIPPSGGGLLSADDDAVVMPIEAEIEFYAKRIADTPKARAAIRTVLEAARLNPGATVLPPAARDALKDLFAESGLGHGDSSGRPGADQDGFDPDAIINDAVAVQANAATPGLLGIGDTLRDAFLLPLRQLSFWTMKDRARQFGETGAAVLLSSLQATAPRTRFHLMGHSFGCIVVSAAVAGPPEGTRLQRPVESLFLVQGALSLWSYATDIPYARGTAGYFNRIVDRKLVSGPIVTTRSVHDFAVGRFYPAGAWLERQLILDEEYPKYGGVGAFGIRGFAAAKDMRMLPAAAAYGFDRGEVYNLEASEIIKNGSGLAGAHSDIAHPEVAHAFWAAALAGQPGSPGSGLLGDGGDGGESHPPHVGGLLAHPPHVGGLLAQVLKAMPPGALTSDLLSSVIGGDNSHLLRDTLARLIPPDGPAAVAAQPPHEQPVSAGQRWLIAEIEGQPPRQPLLKGNAYSLAFDVDVASPDSAIAASPLQEGQLWSGADSEIEVIVQIASTDFGIANPTSSLRLARAGKALARAQFQVTPLHDGRSSLTATIHRDGNFIQQMDLTFEVGTADAKPVEIAARGRLPSSLSVVQRRDVGLSIRPIGQGYDCFVWGAVAATATLELEPALLETAINELRDSLMQVVTYRDASGETIFQTKIDIQDAAARDFALKTMAYAGARLFQQLFFGPGAGADSRYVGNYLADLLKDRTRPLKLQILARRTPVPWGLLYLGDVGDDAELDWDNFIGMRHVIEQIPLQNIPTVSDSMIVSDKPALAVSVNLNSGIDQQMRADFVARQQSFWADAMTSRGSMKVTARTKSTEVVRALADDTTDDQIVYFFCHADSKGLAAAGGPDASSLVLTDGRITLGDLNRRAPDTKRLHGSPLVFINACESAEMSPVFYEGFVPYFMAKGARGVVGTECKTPALFAMTWAERFFQRFLDGQPLGEAFRDLRREFVERHNNPLGLLYGVHCDGDTQIQPALAAKALAAAASPGAPA